MEFAWVLNMEIDKKGLRQCAKLQDLGEGDCCDCHGGGKQSQILLRRLRTK